MHGTDDIRSNADKSGAGKPISLLLLTDLCARSLLNNKPLNGSFLCHSFPVYGLS